MNNDNQQSDHQHEPEQEPAKATPRIGVIGLGAMGWGIAANCHKSGSLQCVWNRTTEKSEVFAAAYPTKVAADLGELAECCDIMVICVSTDADVLAVVNDLLPTIKPESLVIDCSTISVKASKAAAKRLRKRQVEFVDAPVSGGIEGAKQGTLAIMAGGSEAAFAQAQTVFEVIGSQATHMGAVGTGQATKAVNQIMAAGINQAVCEAMNFSEAEGLDVQKTIDVVGSGAASNWFVNHRGLSMTQGEFSEGFKVALHLKDLLICQAMASKSGVNLPLTEITIEDYQALVDEGYGNEDISCLYRIIHQEDEEEEEAQELDYPDQADGDTDNSPWAKRS